jgi:hypothetical protein
MTKPTITIQIPKDLLKMVNGSKRENQSRNKRIEELLLEGFLHEGDAHSNVKKGKA